MVALKRSFLWSLEALKVQGWIKAQSLQDMEVAVVVGGGGQSR